MTHLSATSDQYNDATNANAFEVAHTPSLTLGWNFNGGAQILGLSSTGILTLAAPARLKGYTVGTLPAGVQGYMAFCTDLTAPTFLGTAVGGGAVVGPVFYDGANWKTI